MPKTIHVFFAAGLFGNLNSAQVINLLLTLMKYLCTMPFFWWNQYPSARQGQFCHWGKELWVLWGLEGIFGVCFSVLSVVTAQVPCPLCGALKVGNAQNSRGWGWRCRSSTGLRAGADELPCHTDVTHAMKPCRGFALSQVSQRAEDAWQAVVSWGVEGCLLPAACQSTGGSLGVNARQAFCVFSKNICCVSRWSFLLWGSWIAFPTTLMGDTMQFESVTSNDEGISLYSGLL